MLRLADLETRLTTMLLGRYRCSARVDSERQISTHRHSAGLALELTHWHQINKVKERVEEKAGIPPVQQRLIFGGKAM